MWNRALMVSRIAPSQNRRPLAARIAVAGAFAFTMALAFAGGCSNQGEGERCNHLADNAGADDCNNGLRCYTKDELGAGALTDTCCPENRETATTDLCKINSSVGGDDGGGGLPGIPDASGSDAAALDAGNGGDAPTE